MRSLSSVFKAKSISNNPDDAKAYPDSEPRAYRRDREYEYPDDQKQMMILQAIKKSQHIDNEAMKRAEDIIENAHRKSRQIVQDAEKNGYDQGYVKGVEIGRELAGKEVESALTELKNIIEQIKADEKALAARHEKDIVMLSMEIAKKIMKQQILLDEDAIPKMLDEVLHEYKNETNIKIYLSEYHKSIDFKINHRISKKIQGMAQNISVNTVKDEDVIMVETPDGIIDVSLKSQLEHIKEAMNHTL